MVEVGNLLEVCDLKSYPLFFLHLSYFFSVFFKTQTNHLDLKKEYQIQPLCSDRKIIGLLQPLVIKIRI